ncbi:MAG TPA: HAMP domain-containing histidine kinase [Candidatus Pullilachnospira intestinigallinarum]|nr:HAMP domain-containing histidine kinase [Candidatus Pullilachnospira intestinigallinarum]
MIIIAIAACAAAILLAVLFCLYRRQVQKTCRQLSFLKEHTTNLRLTSDLPFRELSQLTDRINELIDDSRKIRLEARLQENRLKETITNLSHDIRTPLTSMDGYFQLLLESDSPAERNRYLSIIQSRIKSLGEMLEELFTFARLQDADYQLPTERIDFARCIFDTVFSFYEEFRKKGIEPAADFCDGHLFVTGNEEALRRAVQNLIRNALVHGHENFILKLYEEDGQAVFRCANQVEHPEEIDITRVFGRFYKADSARTHTSAGLGLSIARELTERTGGQIRAQLSGNLFEVEIRYPLDA